MAALASIAALALARHAPRDAQTRPPPNPRATNHPGVRRRDALLAVGTLSLCVATDREPSRAAEPERPTRPTACVAGTSCVSTASFRSPANYLPPWEYVGDDATGVVDENAFEALVNKAVGFFFENDASSKERDPRDARRENAPELGSHANAVGHGRDVAALWRWRVDARKRELKKTRFLGRLDRTRVQVEVRDRKSVRVT